MRTSRQKITSRIAIDCLDGLIDSESMSILGNDLLHDDIVLETKFHKPQVICGIDELFAQVYVYFTPEVFSILILGVVSCAAYDALKKVLNFLHSKLKDKKVSRIQNQEVTSVDPAVFLCFKDLRISIPTNIDDDKYQYFVDHLFQYLSNNVKLDKSVVKYDPTDGSFRKVNGIQLISTNHKAKKTKK